MIVTHDGHSFDDALLTPGGWALDVGCRGFGFANKMAEMGLNVIALDPDRDLVYAGPHGDLIRFRRLALVGDRDMKKSMYAGWSNGEANHLADSRPAHASEYYEVPCISLPHIMAREQIDQFEIIKLDCEGAEYDILQNMPWRCAKQLSVEFHDFLGRKPRPNYYAELFSTSLADYEITRHTWGPLSPTNATMNYWDSLFRLRDLVTG